MLNNIINSNISHNVNEINRLNFLNRQRQKKSNDKYNITDIDKKNYFKISNNINLNYNLDQLKNDLVNKNIRKDIKKINNVYKINFKNAPSTGFGDFIRGCYFLLEFTEKFNIDIDFHIYESNIKHYLKYFAVKPIINQKIANNIYKFTDINCSFTNINGIISYDIDNNVDDFINYINSQTIYSNNIFINTVNFPSHFIKQNHVNYMKKILEPTNFLKIDINNLMDNLGLIKNKFITYHIRLGDNFIENKFSECVFFNLVPF